MKLARRFLFLPFLLAPAGAGAQDTGFYLGGSLGQARYPEFCDPSALTCEDTDRAWKLFAGVSVNKYIGLEATYLDFGEAKGTIAGPREVILGQTAMGIAAVASLELAPRFSLFGKLGRVRTEQETPSSASGTTKRKTNESHYGLGAKFDLLPNWAVRAEWERMEETKQEMMSVGVEYRF